MSSTPSRPRRTERLKSRDLGDEFLFYDPQNDRVHVLNASARQVYLLCDGSRTAAEIAQEFGASYGLDREVARRDAEQAILSLLELGLVED